MPRVLGSEYNSSSSGGEGRSGTASDGSSSEEEALAEMRDHFASLRSKEVEERRSAVSSPIIARKSAHPQEFEEPVVLLPSGPPDRPSNVVLLSVAPQKQENSEPKDDESSEESRSGEILLVDTIPSSVPRDVADLSMSDPESSGSESSSSGFGRSGRRSGTLQSRSTSSSDSGFGDFRLGTQEAGQLHDLLAGLEDAADAPDLPNSRSGTSSSGESSGPESQEGGSSADLMPPPFDAPRPPSDSELSEEFASLKASLRRDHLWDGVAGEDPVATQAAVFAGGTLDGNSSDGVTTSPSGVKDASLDRAIADLGTAAVISSSSDEGTGSTSPQEELLPVSKPTTPFQGALADDSGSDSEESAGRYGPAPTTDVEHFGESSRDSDDVMILPSFDRDGRREGPGSRPSSTMFAGQDAVELGVLLSSAESDASETQLPALREKRAAVKFSSVEHELPEQREPRPQSTRPGAFNSPEVRRSTVSRLIRRHTGIFPKQEEGASNFVPSGFKVVGALADVTSSGVLAFIAGSHVANDDRLRISKPLDHRLAEGKQNLTPSDALASSTSGLLKDVMAKKGRSISTHFREKLLQERERRRSLLKSETENRLSWDAEELELGLVTADVLRHIIVTHESGAVTVGHKDPLPGGAGSVEAIVHRALKSLLEQLAIAIRDREVLPLVVQHYDDAGDPASAVNGFHNFIAAHMVGPSGDAKTLRLVKAMSPEILVSPFSELRRSFEVLDCHFVDSSIAWRVHVSIEEKRITVTHIKGCRSTAAAALASISRESPDSGKSERKPPRQNQLETQAFQFVWAFQIQFDPDIQNVLATTLSLPWIGFTKRLDKNTAKALQALRELYHPDSVAGDASPSSERARAGSVTDTPDSLDHSGRLVSQVVGGDVAAAISRLPDTAPDVAAKVQVINSKEQSRKISVLDTLQSPNAPKLSKRQSKTLGLRGRASSLDLKDVQSRKDTIGQLSRRPKLADDKVVEETLGPNHQALFTQWGTTLSKDGKSLKDRLLVLSRFRIFVVHRTSTGKRKVKHQPHLFHLSRIETLDPDHCLLQFVVPADKVRVFQIYGATEIVPSQDPGISSSHKKSEKVQFEISFNAVNVGNTLPAALLGARREIVQGFPFEHDVHFAISPVDRVQQLPPVGELPARGLTHTYEAWCDYFKDIYEVAPPHKQFMAYVKHCSRSQNHRLDISGCPNFDRLDLVPVTHALSHNKFFREVSIEDVSCPKAALAFAETVRKSTFLTTLILRNINNSSGAGIPELGDAILANERSVLMNLDLSGSVLGSKASVMRLAKGLEAAHHLLSLRMANCRMSPDSSATIVRAIDQNPMASIYLQELDLSGNHLSEAGTRALVKWVDGKSDAPSLGERATAMSSLRRLGLSHCGILVPDLFGALARSSVRHTLESLIVSHSSVPDLEALDTIAAYLRSATALHHLDISRCELVEAPVSMLIEATTMNPWMRSLRLCLGGNSLSEKEQVALSVVLCEAAKLRTELQGDICAVEETDDQLIHPSSRKLIVTSSNPKRRSSSKRSKKSTRSTPALPLWATTLGPSLTALHLDHMQLIPLEIARIADACRHFPFLTCLDISGNPVGHRETGWSVFICFAIARLLHDNIGLRVLDMSSMALCQSALDRPGQFELSDEAPTSASDEGSVLKFVRAASKELKTCDLVIAPLCAALSNPACLLEHLDISGNRLGDSGAIALAGCLPGQGSLQRLDLDENGINRAGLQAIASALRCNMTLRKIPEAARDIQAAAKAQKKDDSVGTADSVMAVESDTGSGAAADVGDVIPVSGDDTKWLSNASNVTQSLLRSINLMIQARAARNQRAPFCEVGLFMDVNPRWREAQEDIVFAHQEMRHQNLEMFACLDGHGGRQVVETAASALPRFVERELDLIVTPDLKSQAAGSDPSSVEEYDRHTKLAHGVGNALREGFLQTDALLSHLDMKESGATCACVIVQRDSCHSGGISVSGHADDSDASADDGVHSIFRPDLQELEARLSTFDNIDWEIEMPSPEKLASCGLFADPTRKRPDQVRCFECGCKLFDWNDGDDAEKEHKKSSPDCKFARRGPDGSSLAGHPTDGAWLHVANVGDAVAYLVRRRGAEIQRITAVHNLEDPDERARVESTKHGVINDRVAGALAVSRAFGDFQLKEAVIAEPYCLSMPLDREDTHVILSSDGLVDVCSERDILRSLTQEEEPSRMAARLVHMALARESKDNLSVLVVALPDRNLSFLSHDGGDK